jgi:long-subunit acyl-CoA synthetase (AMP-forming)
MPVDALSALATPARPLDADTVCEALIARAQRSGGDPAFTGSEGSPGVGWASYADDVARAAGGLEAVGVGAGDTVAVMLRNRYEFHVADLAALHLGAVPFSIYNSFTPGQIAHVVGDAGARVVVTQRAFLPALRQAIAAGAPLEQVIVVDGGGEDGELDWREITNAAPLDLRAAAAAIEPDALATLIYTSGTTGPPKGVELTHSNILSLVRAVADALDLHEREALVSWLPMAHIAERLCTHYLPIRLGWTVTPCPDHRAVLATVADVRPSFFFSPPRLWEKLRAGIEAKLDGRAVARLMDAERAALRAQIGFDRLRHAIVGAAPCPPDVVRFWHELGIPLCEVYGMSEQTGVATANTPSAFRIGTAGRPLPGVEVALAADSEVLIRGDVVMRGYRNQPAQTADAIDRDGWLHSGDIGRFDDDGYLRIVDRKKELIINAAGKNMSPANIEAHLKSSSPLIGQAVAIGDRRPYNVALIVLDPDTARAFAEQHRLARLSLDELANHPAIAAEVTRGVAIANEAMARVEQIKRFTILPVDWVPDSDELTPTAKLKRTPIQTKYAHEIEALYAGQGHAPASASPPVGGR